MKSSRAICRFLILLLLSSGLAIAGPWGQEKKHVLLLNSYHQGMDWVDGEVAGIQEVLKAKAAPVELQVEYMDTKRVSNETHFENLRQLMEYKYRNTRLSAIIATDNDAFEFLRRYRDNLFPGVPVIFTGVNFFREESLSGLSDFTGIVETFEGGQTIGLMMQLHPQVRRIVIIIDSTTTGKAVRKELEPMLAPYAAKVNFEFWDSLSLDQLQERLPKLGKDTLVMLMPYARDCAGTYISYAEIADLVSHLSPVPVYGTWDFYMGYGIVGGRLTNAAAQGRAAAEILLRVLGGESARQIPVRSVAPSEFQFDSRQLRRHGIANSALPRESRILFRSWSEIYRSWLWLGGGMSALTVLLAWGTWRNHQLKRRSERALRESEARFRSLTELASDWYWEQDDTGAFTKVTGPVLDMLGLQVEPLVPNGQPGYGVACGWDATQHAQLRARIAAREPFLDFVLCRTHGDGSVQTFQISGEPMFNSWNKFMGYRGIGLEITSRH